MSTATPDAPPAPTPSRAGLRPDTRVLAIGKTGTGKSALIRWLWATQCGRRAGHRWRVLIDCQDTHELVPEHGTCEANGLEEIDWRAEVIRWTPREGDTEEYEALYAKLNELPYGVAVWLDEATVPNDSRKPVPQLRRYQIMGRKLRHMHLACTQYPVGLDRAVVDQADHLLVFQLRRPEDSDRIGKMTGMSGDELRARLRALPMADDGIASHHFLWAHSAREEVPTHEPLTPEQLAEADKLVRALR